MSPNCGGTSFGGPVFDLQTAPNLGSALGWVQERVWAVAMLTSKAGGYVRPGVEVDSTTLPPPSAVPAPSTFPAPAEPKSSSVFVPGFGCLGEGKTANDGVAIAPPTLLAAADLPLGLQQPSSASGLQEGEAIPNPSHYYYYFQQDRRSSRAGVSSCFKPLTNIGTKIPAEVGESVCTSRC